MAFEFNLNPHKISFGLGLVAFYLAGQSLLNEYLIENVLSDETGDVAILLLDLFSVNAEETIPTWYATLLLFLAAVILFFIAAAKRKIADRYTRYWMGLAVIFLYLSMDEGAVIHEIVSEGLEAWLETGGYLTFPWVIVFVPLALLIGVIYLPFLGHLPVKIRNLVVVAGVIYVGGAAGVEVISAGRYAADGGVTFPYLAIATLEELYEMLGVVIFIYGLLLYVSMTDLTAVAGFAAKPAVSHDVDRKRPMFGRWLVPMIVGIIVIVNGAVWVWASGQTAEPEVIEPTSLPFYQAVAELYGGQGVVILGLSEVIEVGNPAAPALAQSLLTLFEDVMIVTLPASRVSIAFASASLPFDEDILVTILVESGESEYVILDRAAVWSIANTSQPYP